MALFHETKFAEQSYAYDDALKDAFQSARIQKKITFSDRSCLEARRGPELLAVNHWSRVLWATAICNEVEQLFCSSESSVYHKGNIFFVTLLDLECARLVTSSATKEDLEQIKTRLRYGLRGFSHIGFIEPAYYTNLQAGVRFNEKRCMFWHTHALVWGCSRGKLSARLRTLEKAGRYWAIIPGVPAVKIQRVRQRTLPRVVGYILKPPNNAYRVSRRDLSGADGDPLVDDSGEVAAAFKQGKSRLRPGERVKMFKIMQSLYLDDLAFAGGEGVALLAGAKARALEKFRCREKRRARKLLIVKSSRASKRHRTRPLKPRR
ncbi:hypothetical protein UB31_35765 [Bradyrhizobium sp. LTSP849]|nr:hypothetical protein UB31_35765 [Bradyrhizobium sp. LTSP849]